MRFAQAGEELQSANETQIAQRPAACGRDSAHSGSFPDTVQGSGVGSGGGSGQGEWRGEWLGVWPQGEWPQRSMSFTLNKNNGFFVVLDSLRSVKSI